MSSRVTVSAVAGALLIGAVSILSATRAASAEERPVAHPAPAGTRVANKYAEICQVCHQATGLGLEGAFPPLAGSEWLNGRSVVPIAIVLHGLQGEITVKGKKFNGMMMPWGAAMSDDDIAATLTYARSSWGNRAAPVTAAEVRAVRTRTASRTTPWTPAEVQALR